ncbi:restriction endonuclease subunit S [Enterococcus faecalis]|uniref:restriction endonuclease subunit S n=1 Tax=Enterococcus faecalis TaxID=1351 RepID=UPI000F502388|nr:restriction endonuclease subunit S [Enterococcus faecalis]EGO8142936.1 restriction endonuclease subunit S [Enterococcus faecalis]EGS1365040.1 restriction endonuclease subunit S [Enterococcus faecalis]EGS7989561.1 restriction endonuclease subunit S [Enterococcus faecalis]EKZ0361856.1 restriction endonuclease subunit S [Enterococcus faecalis]
MNLLIVFTLIGVWELCKLGTLAEIVRGASPRPIQDSKWFDNTSDVGWLRISDVTEQNGRIYKLEQKLSKVGQEKTRVLRKPHLLLSIAATVGKPVVNYVNTGVHDGFLIFLNPLFDREFMFQWLEMFTPKWQKYGQPGSQLNLNSELVRNQELRMPSTNEQEKIGMLFQYLDDTITLHQRKLDQLKELKKAYLQLMFPKKDERVPKLRFADFEDDWQLCKLGEVFNLENGFAFQSEYFTMKRTKSIVLTPGNVEIGGGFKNGKGRYYSSKGKIPKKFIFEPDDIFITMTDLTPSAQSLGYPARIPNDEYQYLHNQRLGKITNFQCDCKFIFQLLCTERYHKYIVSTASGTTVKHSSVKKILNYKSSIPLKKEEQRIIGIFFESLDENINTNQNKLAILKDLKKSYLQNMFI